MSLLPPAETSASTRARERHISLSFRRGSFNFDGVSRANAELATEREEEKVFRDALGLSWLSDRRGSQVMIEFGKRQKLPPFVGYNCLVKNDSVVSRARLLL